MSLLEPIGWMPSRVRFDDFDDDEIADWASLEATENGESVMGTVNQVLGEYMNVVTEPEQSGIYVTPESIGAVEMPTVEDIDALPSPADESARIDEANDAFDLLTETSQTSLMLARLCRLSTEGQSLLAAQALQLLGNKVEVCKAYADSKREEQRAAESALINALGHFREYTFKSVG